MSETTNLPPALMGFEHINRYWDKQRACIAAKILPGELYVTRMDEMIVTVLGSCVSACIRDVKMEIGGMNHFMLPSKAEYTNEQWGDSVSSAARYGNWAMEFLINEILKLGGKKENLEIKVFGGANVMAHLNYIGERNITFVKHYIEEEGFDLAASDVGGLYPRKILYFPKTGAVKMRKIRDVQNETILERELNYSRKLNDKPRSSGGVELFD
ncbi:MAG: chemoreceptor glutamine deamidase CheD [Oleiphilus sp.]